MSLSIYSYQKNHKYKSVRLNKYGRFIGKISSYLNFSHDQQAINQFSCNNYK